MFPAASFDVIVVSDRDVGRLYVDRTSERITLIDIALLTEARALGVGTAILRTILDESLATGIPVTIHVEHANPARYLYRRLGFRDIEDTGIYTLMLWEPADAAPQLNTAS